MLGPLDAQTNVLDGDHAIFKLKASGYQLQSPTISTFSARSNRERLNDPSASMLDLDDDPRLSVASDVYDDQETLPDSNDNDDSSRRLSYLGPNLRFHSRAPWETDDISLDNGEESRYGILNSSKKALGFSITRRPSADSSHSHAKSNQSFETMSSRISYPRGALYALAQESLSTSSLGASMPIPGRSKFPMNRGWSDSSNDNSTFPSTTLDTHSNHTPLTNSSQHELSDTQLSSTSNNAFVYTTDSFHPYANPDLVFQVPEERHHLLPKQGISRSDSIGTVTDSIVQGALSKSETGSTLAPATCIPSVHPRNRASAIQGREISSPITVVNTLHLDSKLHANEEPLSVHSQPAVENLPGWTERISYPGFSLISLEEARARKRSATIQPTATLLPPLSAAPLSDISHPDSHSSDSGRHHIEYDGFSPHSQRTRARSVSAGVKAKVALQSIVNGGQPKLEVDVARGKTVKHRKSGFMRLFNGGRGQDREEKLPPPPLPSLSDTHAAIGAAQKTFKVAAYRKPAPHASPFLEISPADVTSPVKSSASLKRPIPSLSINTQAQRSVFTAKNDDLQTRTASFTNVPRPPWLKDPLPQSAPANVSDFPALKLRPVSTAFSTQFEDHIVVTDVRPSLETDVDTPGSPTRIFSPVTPGSASPSDRSNTDPKLAAFLNPVSEDHSSVVSALQEQLLNAKLTWQRQLWELENQVRDLKAEVDDLRKVESEGTFCSSCGRGRRTVESSLIPPADPAGEAQNTKNLGVINRPRARTGTSSRFGNVLP